MFSCCYQNAKCNVLDSCNLTVVNEFDHYPGFLIIKFSVKVNSVSCFIDDQLILGIWKFGFITIYLSEPLTRGLTCGAGVHVVTSQLHGMFQVNLGNFHGGLKIIYVSK